MKKAVIIVSILVLVLGNSYAQNSKDTVVDVPEERLVDDISITINQTDSTHIGQSGKNKVEFSSRLIFDKDNIYIVIKFYTKSAAKKWVLTQKFSFKTEISAVGGDMQIADFNNDGFGDMTYVSAEAARGANEIRRLFVYNKNTDRFVYIKNSEIYPNLTYNKELDCINAFAYYGCNATVFLKLQGDSLKRLANVELCGNGELTVTEYDKFENKKSEKREINNEFEMFTPFTNYNPLKQ